MEISKKRVSLVDLVARHEEEMLAWKAWMSDEGIAPIYTLDARRNTLLALFTESDTKRLEGRVHRIGG